MRLNCSTCLELITPSDDLFCTPCGHVFHHQCVLQWFESKKNCPQCRHPANEKNIRKIYLSEVDGEDAVNPEDLQNKLDNAQLKVRTLAAEKEAFKTKFKETEENNAKLKEEIKKIETSRRKAEQATKEYKSQISFWKEERDRFQGFQQDAEKFKKQLEKYTMMERVLGDSVGDVNLLLHERGCFDRESRDLATLVVELKKKLVEVKRLKALADRKAEDVMHVREEDRRKIKSLSIQISELKSHHESANVELKLALDQIKALSDKNEELTSKLTEQERRLKFLQENNSDPTPIDWRDDKDTSLDNLSLSSMDSPAVSYGIIVGEKRKPLNDVKIENFKRPKFQNLMEIGTQKCSGQAYDGLGGRSKPDIFPTPLSRPVKKPARKNNFLEKREKQKQTIDRYFGNFDTP